MSGLPIEGSPPYAAAARKIAKEAGVTVRKWRDNNSGVAHTGSPSRWIQAPQPRGPISYGVFAHEVAHQKLHRGSRWQRWEEEAQAWDWALATFDRFGLPGKDEAAARAAQSVSWALIKAVKRSSRPGDLLERMIASLPAWWHGQDALREWVEWREARLASRLPSH